MLVGKAVVDLDVVEICRGARNGPVGDVVGELSVSGRQQVEYICHHFAGGKIWIAG